MLELGDKWKAWVERFWWLRGAAAAMSMLAIVPNFVVGLDKLDILRITHAIIVEWNLAATQIGNWIGGLMSIPPVPASVVNTGIFSASIVFPLIYATLKPGQNISELIDKWQRRTRLNKLTFANRKLNVTSLKISLCFLCFVMIAYYWFFAAHGLGSFGDSIESQLTYLYLIFLVLFSIVFIYLAVRVVSGFGRGIVYVVSFFAVLELLYLMNIGGGALNAWACEVLEIPAGEC